MKRVVLNFNDYKNAGEVHRMLAGKLGFPEYYGNNLDALYDVLTELSEDTCVLAIRSGQGYEEGFLTVMRDAAMECRRFTLEENDMINDVAALMAIDSPSAYYEHAQEYIANYFAELGFVTETLRKGGVLVNLGGEGEPLIMMCHADTLGAVVGEIKENGHLKMANVTLNPINIETANCHVITADDTVYEGTVQLVNPSIHVNEKYSTTERTFDTIEVVLDEVVKSKDDVKALGIQPGDVVAVEPNFRLTPSGYLKSRYLDDKASAAIIMSVARDIAAGKLSLNRKVYVLVTFYEEYGLGGQCGLPADVVDILSVDMGCVGTGLNCTEQQVSICRKDRAAVYHRGMTGELMDVAKANGIDYAVDIYPRYSSDANMAMTTGIDARHALIGPGVYASHGYERTHIDGMNATKALIEHYIGSIEE